MLRRIVSTAAPWPTLLIRAMVGAVFLSEGIQKFLFADQRDACLSARAEQGSTRR